VQADVRAPGERLDSAHVLRRSAGPN
jgi:hypothetical protein